MPISFDRDFDFLCFGGDQIWAPNVLDLTYLGNFKSTAKKFAYAASIGLNNIPEDKKETYRFLLSSFEKIGIREQAGRDLLKTACQIQSTVVLDPCFLLSLKSFKKLERSISIPCKRHAYAFCYFLNPNHSYRYSVETYCNNSQLYILGDSRNTDDKSWMSLVYNISACEFLWLIDNAKVVITDSYHGTIFSLLYHKSFITFRRFSNDDPINQNSRIEQLAHDFDIGDKIYNPTDEIRFHDTDWNTIDMKINTLKAASLGFLRQTLNTVHHRHYSY